MCVCLFEKRWPYTSNHITSKVQQYPENHQLRLDSLERENNVRKGLVPSREGQTCLPSRKIRGFGSAGHMLLVDCETEFLLEIG